MANAYKNDELDMTTSLSDVYTCPGSTEAVVLMCQVANIDGTNSADATVAWTDSSNSDKVTYLVKETAVSAGTAISAMLGNLALEAGDKIQAQASANSDLQITISVLEVS